MSLFSNKNWMGKFSMTSDDSFFLPYHSAAWNYEYAMAFPRPPMPLLMTMWKMRTTMSDHKLQRGAVFELKEALNYDNRISWTKQFSLMVGWANSTRCSHAHSAHNRTFSLACYRRRRRRPLCARWIKISMNPSTRSNNSRPVRQSSLLPTSVCSSGCSLLS